MNLEKKIAIKQLEIHTRREKKSLNITVETSHSRLQNEARRPKIIVICFHQIEVRLSENIVYNIIDIKEEINVQVVLSGRMQK